MDYSKKDIKELLPHREPFLFVDRQLSSDGTSAVGEYTFSADRNDFFRGHFPGNPIVPGVILLESMAQVCAASVVANGPVGARPPLFYLAAVSDVRFLRPVMPGDTLVTRASCGRSRGRFHSFDAEGFVGEERVVKATLKCFVEE